MYFFFCFFFVFLGWLLLFFFSVESKRNETKRIKRLIFGNARSKLMLLKAALKQREGGRRVEQDIRKCWQFIFKKTIWFKQSPQMRMVLRLIVLHQHLTTRKDEFILVPYGFLRELTLLGMCFWLLPSTRNQ